MTSEIQNQIRHLRGALQQNPHRAPLWRQLGGLHFRRNEIERAGECFRNVLRIEPNDAAAFHDCGIACKMLGHVAEAEAMLRESIRRNPTQIASALSLADMLKRLGRRPEAEVVYTDAVARNPNNFDILREYTNALIEAMRPAEAFDATLSFIKLNGQSGPALAHLAVCCEAAGQLDRALDIVSAVIDREPPQALEMRLASFASIAGQLARVPERARVADLLRAALPASLQTGGEAALLNVDFNTLGRFAYSLPYYQTPDPLLVRVLAAAGKILAARTRPLPPATPAYEGRLRVGYVSYNFTNHPIGHLLSHVFEHHDASGVDHYCYSTHRNRSDVNDYAGRIERATPNYRDCRGWTNERIAAQIRADDIHVLIDLDGYLAGGKPDLFAMRPAPIQIHWLQHLAGMPAPFIDYTIVDRVLVRDAERQPANGPLIRLADAFQCGDKVPLPATRPRRADHGLPEKAFVFCAFGAWLKFDEEAFDAWTEILRAVPDSVLWLSEGGTEAARENLRAAAEARGVARTRLVLAPRLDDKVAHLDRHRCADLFLDTFAFSAATTAMDALWAGLPVLTRPGPTAQSRLAESHVRAIGMTDLIVRDTRAYIDTAVALAKDRKELDRLTKRLRLLAPKSRLFNAERMAKQLGQIYQKVWERHTTGAPKESFDVRM